MNFIYLPIPINLKHVLGQTICCQLGAPHVEIHHLWSRLLNVTGYYVIGRIISDVQCVKFRFRFRVFIDATDSGKVMDHRWLYVNV